MMNNKERTLHASAVEKDPHGETSGTIFNPSCVISLKTPRLMIMHTKFAKKYSSKIVAYNY